MSGTYSNAPYIQEGYKKTSITLAILVVFFVISICLQTKIPTLDMKIQVYYKFRKN
jgi:hypothetical protein